MIHLGFPSGSAVKNSPAIQEPQGTRVQSPGQEDPLEEDTATHSSILAWRIPWTEEPDGLQSMRSQRVRHDWSDLACIIHLVHSEGAFKKNILWLSRVLTTVQRKKKKTGKICRYHRHSFLWNFLRGNNRLKSSPQTGWNSSNHSKDFWPSESAKPHKMQALLSTRIQPSLRLRVYGLCVCVCSVLSNSFRPPGL